MTQLQSKDTTRSPRNLGNTQLQAVITDIEQEVQLLFPIKLCYSYKTVLPCFRIGMAMFLNPFLGRFCLRLAKIIKEYIEISTTVTGVIKISQPMKSNGPLKSNQIPKPHWLPTVIFARFAVSRAERFGTRCHPRAYP